MRLDAEGITLLNGVNVRLIKSKKTTSSRQIKWLVAGKTVVMGTAIGDSHYVRVRPKYGWGDRAMTPVEVEAVASSLIDITLALQEPLLNSRS